jgi:ATP-dependent Clp protease ATP-binding subunit ClpX
LSVPTAAEIKAELDRYVVGQDYAKKTISAAVSAHYRLAAYEGPVHIKKSNLLLLGPTGSGKTYTMQVIARMLEVPYAAMVATAITPAGWYGDKPETAVAYLYQKAKQLFGKDAFKKTQTGIIYIDEIDKLAAPLQRRGSDETFNTVQVQQALLRVIEGVDVILDGNPLNTARILFVVSGAFIGLERWVQMRLVRRFTRATPDPFILRQLLPVDLINFGFIPEFVGRFPVTAPLELLSESDLVHILRDVKDSLVQQWQARLSIDGCTLEVDEVVLRHVARTAIMQGTGARGLETAFWKILEPALVNLEPGTHVHLSELGIGRAPVISEGEVVQASPLSFDSEPIPEGASEGG